MKHVKLFLSKDDAVYSSVYTPLITKLETQDKILYANNSEDEHGVIMEDPDNTNFITFMQRPTIKFSASGSGSFTINKGFNESTLSYTYDENTNYTCTRYEEADTIVDLLKGSFIYEDGPYIKDTSNDNTIEYENETYTKYIHETHSDGYYYVNNDYTQIIYLYSDGTFTNSKEWEQYYDRMDVNFSDDKNSFTILFETIYTFVKVPLDSVTIDGVTYNEYHGVSKTNYYYELYFKENEFNNIYWIDSSTDDDGNITYEIYDYIAEGDWTNINIEEIDNIPIFAYKDSSGYIVGITGDEQGSYDLLFGYWNYWYICRYISNILLTVNKNDKLKNKTIKYEAGDNLTITVDLPIVNLVVNYEDGVSENDTLTAILLPETLEEIPDGAFYGCSKLTNIIIPDRVKTIGSAAFEYCSELIALQIGKSVTSIGNYALMYCPKLSYIYSLPKTAPSIEEYTFGISSNDFTGHDYYNLYINTLEILSGATGYDEGYWYDILQNETCCGFDVTSDEIAYNNKLNKENRTIYYSTTNGVYLSSLTSMFDNNIEYQDSSMLILKRKITIIPAGAFENLTSLRRISLPDTIKTIGTNAFYGCSLLTYVKLPSNLTLICTQAFYDCSLNEITLPETLTDIYYRAFAWCSLSTINIPSSVSFINEESFIGNNSLYKIAVDDNNPVYNDGNGSNCIIETSTNTLVLGCETTAIPNTVTTIGNYAFNGKGISYLTIPTSVTTIGQCAFYNCYSLKYVNIPSSVTSINKSFLGSYLTSIAVDDNNPVYNDGNGSNCIIETSTNTLILGCNKTTAIPNTVTTISDSAFFGCSSISTLTIPTSVTTIESYAFAYCSSLTLTVPNTVTTIGSSAFTSVPKVIYSGTATGSPWGAKSVVTA